ncbi:DUF1501 domain-containing protein [Rubinisphaera italica]|uniref:Sulfatase n=1 Tax=Rubinisphaera italica TaxID=2527969 RepID=A0A5C5XC26_9PLAN|nr:DUF1501 domain-containing protein [Rubinisphaera italica]TWT60560.1 hypothetical protein Pan54_12740 [Rubinisphaera italica]
MKSFDSASQRREFLWKIGGGLGGIAMCQILARDAAASNGSAIEEGLHHPPKAKRVIQLFMTGGASPMDTFDYKPELIKLHGQKLGPNEKPEGFTAMPGAIMKSPFEFKQHGECGRWVSSVFPHQAKWVDEMAFLMAMSSKTNVHGPATYMMNSGFLLPGFPCMGAWISYGLGNLSDNFPTFVVLPDSKGLPYNQRGPFSSGFLPAIHQGTVINAGSPNPVPALFPHENFKFATKQSDHDGMKLLQQINRAHAELRPDDTRLDARIRSYELAAKMQLSAPEAFDLSRESDSTQKAYGLGEAVTDDFGRRCLLARRLIERGTRFVQVWSGPQGATGNWDNHGSIPNELPPIAMSVDQPIGALIGDLKSRGLFEDTLLIWTTEFGRTPFAQGGEGRDHNGGTFVTWLAGAGIKPGMAHGKSDDWGYQTAEGQTYCYDFHATILHLLGLDHTRLTFLQNGIDRRLTDVHGHVIHEILDEANASQSK